MSGMPPKLVRLAPSGTSLGPLQIRFQFILALQARVALDRFSSSRLPTD